MVRSAIFAAGLWAATATPAFATDTMDRVATASAGAALVTEMAAERVLYAIDQGLNAAALAVTTTDSKLIVQHELRRIVERLPGVRAVLGIDLTGRLVYDSYAYPAAQLDLSDRAYFQAAMASSDLVIGDVVVGRTSGTEFVPVAKRAGAFVWVAVTGPYSLISIDASCSDCISALLRPDGRPLVMFPPQIALPQGFFDTAVRGHPEIGTQVATLNRVVVALSWRRNEDFPLISVAVRGAPDAAAVDVDTQ